MPQNSHGFVRSAGKSWNPCAAPGKIPHLPYVLARSRCARRSCSDERSRHRRDRRRSAPTLVPRLAAAGHRVRGVRARPARVTDPAVRGRRAATRSPAPASTRRSPASTSPISSSTRWRRGGGPPATGFADARPARGRAVRATRRARAGVRRVVYLGGLVPRAARAASAHLASRLEVEETLLAAAPEAVALRASIVIGARSRSFRFLVRLVERAAASCRCRTGASTAPRRSTGAT